MDVGLVEAVLQNIAGQIAGVAGVLVPIGTGLATSFLVLTILLLGANMILGGAFVPPIVRSMGAAAGTFWVIQVWPDLIQETMTSSRNIIGLFIGGYGGPTDLFAAAYSVTSRVLMEPAGWSWSLSGTVGAMAMQVLIPIATVFITIGLCMPGIMAILAELSLLLGAAVAPLILPALCFQMTAPLGWGAINFVVSASIRIIVMGLISVVFGNAITDLIVKPGPEEVMTYSALAGLMLTALLALVASLSANSIAGSLVGGGLGSMGWSSARGAGAIVQGAVQSGATIVGGAVAGAPATARGAAAVGRNASAAARAGVNVARSIGNGSAFGG
jgi:hypothetical protein